MLDSVFVLHRQLYRETSQLLDIYSLTQGRISALHRTSKRQPALQPFTLYGIQLKGKSDLKNISHVEALGAPFSLKKQNLYCGFYINEILQRLLSRYEANPRIFEYYRQALSLLSDSQHTEPCLRRFEYQLLSELGYGFSWSQDSQGMAINEDAYYLFEPSIGFYQNPAQNFISEAHIQSLAARGRSPGFSGKLLHAIDQQQWQDVETWQVAKQVMRIALQPLLGDKPLVSRSLFQYSQG